MTRVVTTAGITATTADDGSGQSLKHLVRDEPVPFREQQPIPLPEQQAGSDQVCLLYTSDAADE